MKKTRKIFAFSLLASALLFAAACSSGKDKYVLPTLAPTYTPTPAPEVNTSPTPTPKPDANNTTILELDGEDFNQTVNFGMRGISKTSVKPIAYSGKYSFFVSGRETATDGVSMEFVDPEGTVYNVIGKTVHFAAWVYHESNQTENFAVTLSMRRLDGTPEALEVLSVKAVPSGRWALLEGDIPVYANISSPSLSIEMTSSKKDFYFDDIRVTYDPNSSVGVNTAYNNAMNFNGEYFDFEDKKVHLEARGDSDGLPSLEVVEGSCDDGKYCLFVSDRTYNWNGAQIDLSEYGLNGTKLWITYSAKHKGTEKIRVTCTLEQRNFGQTQSQYITVTQTDSVLPDEWADASGTITIGDSAEVALLYFETAATQDFYLDNVLISTKDPSTIVIDKDPNGVGTIVDPSTKTEIDTTGFVTIHSLNADQSSKETQIFESRGNASATVVSKGHSQNGFLISGRTANWNGVGLQFKNLDNQAFDVIGKEVYISAWVYQETGQNLDFSATLQVNKPDGTSTWPERVEIAVLPSGQWTHVEGIIPVYANVKAPQINFEVPGSDTADFMLDDIIISYNPNSSVDPNPDYAEESKELFRTIELSFEDNDAFFTTRGTGRPSIVGGGHESSKCLAVTGRTDTWNGVEADLSKYDLAGKSIEVTYWVCHDESFMFAINMTAEQSDGETTTYTPVVVGSEIEDGKWVKYSNVYTVPANAKMFKLYFESPDKTASFYVDDVTIKLN